MALSPDASQTTVPVTSEDNDLLERSTKKKKRDSTTIDNTEAVGVGGSESPPVKSFKETLMGNKMINDEWMDKDLDECVSDDEEVAQIDPDVPVVRFPNELKTRILSIWDTIYLVGRSYRFDEMVARLQNRWHMNEFDTLYLGNGFFVCSFESQRECRRVLTDGPYFIGSHFLHVQKWRPNFRAENEVISNLVVWVRFPNIPPEFLDEEVIRLIAKKWGNRSN